MKLFLLSIFLISSLNNDWTSEEKLKATSNSAESKMSAIEKEVMYYINLVRINPSKFEKEVLQPYLQGKKISRKYVSSLKKELKNLKPLTELKHTQKLFEFAKHHAKTTGKIGKVGHKSVLFKSYKSRSKKLLQTYSNVGENIQYGYNDGELIVLDLLIDEGIKDLGHRRNILNKDFEYIGISIQNHKKYNHNCVIEFGGALNK